MLGAQSYDSDRPTPVLTYFNTSQIREPTSSLDLSQFAGWAVPMIPLIPMTPMGQRATDRAEHHVVRGDSEVDVLDEGDLEAVRVRVRVRVRVGVRVWAQVRSLARPHD